MGTSNEGDDRKEAQDDEEFLDTDDWELLDLEDVPDESSVQEQKSTVQPDQASGSLIGILKNQSSEDTSAEFVVLESSQRRCKPGVSFEPTNLVTEVPNKETENGSNKETTSKKGRKKKVQLTRVSVSGSSVETEHKNMESFPVTLATGQSKPRRTTKSKPIESILVANVSGNDLSDVADMDESWFVTPPPCFTGSSRLDELESKAKEAARENELIEHPSIYVVTSSSTKTIDTAQARNTDDLLAKGRSSKIVDPVSQKSVVLRKTNKKQDIDVDVSSADLLLVEADENLDLRAVGKGRVAKGLNDRRAPTQVEPLKAERLPGWQLRRKRSKRRPLSASVVNSNGSTATKSPEKRSRASPMASVTNSAISSCCSSARSTPTLIDRIGNSIVASLSNLAGGLAGVSGPRVGVGLGQMQVRGSASEEQKARDSSGRDKSVGEFRGAPIVRRQLAKSSMDRRNECAKVASNLRRADRRLKMHSHLNGISVNRKVHTNFH